MPNNLPSAPEPSDASVHLAAPDPLPLPVQSLEEPLPPQGPAFNWRRYVAALWRYKWLMLAVVLLGAAVGFGASRLIPPQYWAGATIWIEPSGGDRSGPIRPSELLRSQSWAELLRSYTILENVAREQRLFLQPASAADAEALSSLRLTNQFTPGSYRLSVDGSGRSYELSTASGATLERGTVGDSIGKELGFLWAPPASALRPGRTVEFQLNAPSDAVRKLTERLKTRMDPNANFMGIELTDSDPKRVAATLNAIVDRFIAVAAELKRAQLEELTVILNEQLQYAEQNLRDAEIALESFRVRTVTLPSDKDAFPVLPGQQRDPAFSSFFSMRIEREQLRQDREAIQRALSEARRGRVPVNALEVIPSVQASSELRGALDELTNKRAELRALQYRYTDEFAGVKRLQDDIATLERQNIPNLTAGLLNQLSVRESELETRVESASGELRQIPTRTIEEARLVRRVAVAENLYTMLRQRYEESRLAAASSIPDVRILDRATAPQRPFNQEQRQRVIVMALMGSLGIAVLGAILLDRADPRLRYPEQVTHEMGLPILGAIPQVKSTKGRLDAENTTQIIEAFREVRLALVHSYGAAGPLMVTVTSPGAGDGKSFITSNLALAFADVGYRTLLIDGDTRKGGLHRLFERVRRPGLTDYLAGKATREEIVQSTASPSLDLIACGTRMQDAPELLGTSAMARLLAELRSRYQIVLVDSPPLGAGVDPFALATLTGNLLMVVRTGSTDRSLAGAKLHMVDRLPIRILGAVLNDVQPRGMYRYYSYLAGYDALDEGSEGNEETKQLQGV